MYFSVNWKYISQKRRFDEISNTIDYLKTELLFNDNVLKKELDVRVHSEYDRALMDATLHCERLEALAKSSRNQIHQIRLENIALPLSNHYDSRNPKRRKYDCNQDHSYNNYNGWQQDRPIRKRRKAKNNRRKKEITVAGKSTISNQSTTITNNTHQKKFDFVAKAELETATKNGVSRNTSNPMARTNSTNKMCMTTKAVSKANTDIVKTVQATTNVKSTAQVEDSIMTTSTTKTVVKRTATENFDSPKIAQTNLMTAITNSVSTKNSDLVSATKTINKQHRAGIFSATKIDNTKIDKASANVETTAPVGNSMTTICTKNTTVNTTPKPRRNYVTMINAVPKINTRLVPANTKGTGKETYSALNTDTIKTVTVFNKEKATPIGTFHSVKAERPKENVRIEEKLLSVKTESNINERDRIQSIPSLLSLDLSHVKLRFAQSDRITVSSLNRSSRRRGSRKSNPSNYIKVQPMNEEDIMIDDLAGHL